MRAMLDTVKGDFQAFLGNNNLLATTDPTTANDVTQGYSPGSQWFNSTAGALRFWVCRDATAGVAKWSFAGVDLANGGTFPTLPAGGLSTSFGSGSALILPQGVINRQISAAGIQPGATAADNVLAVFSLPANSLDGTGNRVLTVTAAGIYGSTANNKRVKIFFNPATAVVGSTIGASGTLMADTGTVATNGGGWTLSGSVVKYGAANSNTQLVLSNGAFSGAVSGGISIPALATAVENAAILIAVTGDATTAATDILFQYLEVDAKN